MRFWLVYGILQREGLGMGLFCAGSDGDGDGDVEWKIWVM